MRRTILTFAGIIGLLFGVLWLLQGLGVVDWPAGNAMFGKKIWAWRGGALALVSLILILAMRTLPDRERKRGA